MSKESFLLYKSFYEPIKCLKPEEKGELLDAIFNYQIEGAEPGAESKILMPFLFFKNQFRLDAVKYEKIVLRNQENGTKGGRPAKENPNNPVGLEKPKKADKDNVNGKANDLFDQFYSNCPKKVGRKKAEGVFIQLPEDIQLKAIEGIKAYKAKCQRERTEDKFIAHPLTYLNQARWEDEYRPTIESSPYTPEEIRKFKTLHLSGMGLPAEFDKQYLHLIIEQ